MEETFVPFADVVIAKARKVIKNGESMWITLYKNK